MNSKDIGKSKEHSLEKRLFKEIADEFQKSTVALKPKMSKSSSLLEDNLFSDDKDDNDLFTKATVKIEHKKGMLMYYVNNVY